jgi:hypothetical protein
MRRKMCMYWEIEYGQRMRIKNNVRTHMGNGGWIKKGCAERF